MQFYQTSRKERVNYGASGEEFAVNASAPRVCANEDEIVTEQVGY